MRLLRPIGEGPVDQNGYGLAGFEFDRDGDIIAEADRR